MLDPNDRTLLTAALRPPIGYVFDQALAATYSLDLTTLLSIPVHLALFAHDNSHDLLRNQIALMEALNRTVSKLGIYCQQGQIHVPTQRHILYGLLEPAIVEVRAPGGGSFHPKFWILRYRDQDQRTLLRLIVLSRNLTNDRCWDVSLVLDGEPGGRLRAMNRELADLVRKLPDFAAGSVPDNLKDQCRTLADEVHRTDWELPGDYESLHLHVLGVRRRKWLPAGSKRLAVVSPFCSADALRQLTENTEEPVLLVSRIEELQKLPPECAGLFGRTMTLAEAAETEDGEDSSANPSSLRGLHAKIYIAENGWDTHLYVGSANATSSALLGGANIEVLAELAGKRSRVKGIDDLLEKGGMADMLEDFHAEAAPAEDAVLAHARELLDRAATEICSAGMSLACSGAGDVWRLSLASERPVFLDGIDSFRAWLVTVGSENSIDASLLKAGQSVGLPECALSSITGLVAFEAVIEQPALARRFVLNLPITGLPAGRRAAVIRTVVSNRDGFLRYLMFLLAEAGEGQISADHHPGAGTNSGFRYLFRDDFPLLEELTRALSREPGRLLEIRRLVADLESSEEGRQIIPERFRSIWTAFEPFCLEPSE